MPTAVEVVLAIVGIVVVCLVAGAIDAWWEQRKRNKDRLK